MLDEVRRAWPYALAAIQLTSTEPACQQCAHVTRYGNCGDPVAAGLTGTFMLVPHPHAGAACPAYRPAAIPGP